MVTERGWISDKVCAYGWGQNPGTMEATGIEPYPYQTTLKI
jgi:hypothetical protein